MKKRHTCLRFTLAYLIFCIVFMSSAIGLSVLAEGETPILINEDTASKPPEIQNTPETENNFLLLIDAGHGGEDGGAVGADGTLEKDLNLLVSENLADLSLLFGLPYGMTRDSDELLYDRYGELQDYTGKKKSFDLKNRLKISEETNASLFLSIHMNKFTSPAYSGLQVYYSPNNDDGRVIAEAIRTYNQSHLQRDNTRECKAAGSSIFLLNRLQIPAVLVECGFLSNPEECAKLCNKDYRCSLACTVFVPVLEYSVRYAEQNK